MKIEAGKRYRTRDGRIVKVLTTEASEPWEAWGYFGRDPCRTPQEWSICGSYHGTPDADIIAPVLTAEEVIREAFLTLPHHFDPDIVAERFAAALREAGLLREGQP